MKKRFESFLNILSAAYVKGDKPADIDTQLKEFFTNNPGIPETNLVKAHDVEDGSLQIVVLDRDFVFIGRITHLEDEQRTIIDDAKNIRKWGTDKGLGQLRDGPRPETILDECGTITVPDRSLIFFIECSEHGWAKVFPN